ncbi:hypothetical protein BOW53_04535 [Solemya pervernicosa gill symbiont]|uniref:Protein Smg homolog n=2 Tax=Gammaproteobacteria incertae sedis TaxID=118884 RepID=A0A1T2L870_9GAMM|nr:DUF494 domain-containing protein [Candidatus Reidiella endopervernicosa]OOZ41252.1 hypothetical protein BOW53_04535 [Solemya pervernicosa gill symbiont]QKQ25264.1 DUF494 domain-containing protein [Candidatus Reidiella endopervernicosa]
MKENVLDALMYLFEQYYLDDDSNLTPDHDSIKDRLNEAGFLEGEIDKAIHWLEELADNQHLIDTIVPANRSFRIYTDQEAARLNKECRGFLIFLEQSGILTPLSRELVIERFMALNTDEIDLEQLKWVVLMVLFTRPGEEEAYAWMEDLVFDNPTGYLH